MLRAPSLLLFLVATASAEEVVRFPGADGFELEGTYVAAKAPNAPVAICLHQHGSDKGSWKPLLPALETAGFTTLALDLRGQGGSTKQGSETLSVQGLPSEKLGELLQRGPDDVKAALAWLRSKGNAAKQVVLFGAAEGCSVALLTYARMPEVKALVLLSPAEEHFGVDVRPALNAWSGPVLIISMMEDPHHEEAEALLTQCVKAHREDRKGPRWDFVEYEAAGHGTAALELQQTPRGVQQNAANRNPSAERLFKIADPRKLIITWLVDGARLGRMARGG